ncbi:MAG: acyl-CoA dehydrogenase family protein [Pacificimonas sp.]
MSSVQEQMLATADRLLADQANADAWEEAGFGLLLTPEADDGIGGDWGDAFAVLRRVSETLPALDVVPLMIGSNDRGVAAFARTSLAAGALDRVTAMSVEHANLREQFARPLAKFQAVQQALALLASGAAAANAAGRGAAAALDWHGGNADAASYEIAAAKLRANAAMATGAALAHQAHGAIGFTADHDLHRFTGALMRWREEGGNDRYWAGRLGAMIAARGADRYWSDLTARSDVTSPTPHKEG